MPDTFERGNAFTLVRNPSWEKSRDGLRAAYADRIELTVAADPESAYADVDAGRLDLVLDWPAPADLADRYRADPELRRRLLVVPGDQVWYAAMNVAQPPFDDVHVRRAANLAVDKASIVDALGPGGGRLATHAAPDSLEGNLLLDYDPYPTQGLHGDLAAAQAEMALSRYDADGDGRCDQAACVQIPAVGIEYPAVVLPPEVADLVRQSLARLGLELDVRTAPPLEAFTALGAQEERHAVVLNAGWTKDFPNGSGWFPVLLDSDNPRENMSLVGATPESLAGWGYPVSSVPSVDAEIAECIRTVGGAQTRCWASLDQLVMEQVVPWVVYAARNETRVVSDRVASVSIDQFTTLPSLDRIALEPGS
jgi:ABC-type transport system substrate-binding protein